MSWSSPPSLPPASSGPGFAFCCFWLARLRWWAGGALPLGQTPEEKPRENGPARETLSLPLFSKQNPQDGRCYYRELAHSFGISPSNLVDTAVASLNRNAGYALNCCSAIGKLAARERKAKNAAP